MKRVIRASTAVKASVVPPEYAKLAQILRQASKAIDDYVDPNLEGYIDWDEIQMSIRTGLEAISQAGHDLEDNGVGDDYIEESTNIVGAADASSKFFEKEKFVKMGHHLYNIDDEDIFCCVRMDREDIYDMPEEVQEIVSGLEMGTDSGGYIYIYADTDVNLYPEQFKALEEAGISPNSTKFDVVYVVDTHRYG